MDTLELNRLIERAASEAAASEAAASEAAASEAAARSKLPTPRGTRRRCAGADRNRTGPSVPARRFTPEPRDARETVSEGEPGTPDTRR